MEISTCFTCFIFSRLNNRNTDDSASEGEVLKDIIFPGLSRRMGIGFLGSFFWFLDGMRVPKGTSALGFSTHAQMIGISLGKGCMGSTSKSLNTIVAVGWVLIICSLTGSKEVPPPAVTLIRSKVSLSVNMYLLFGSLYRTSLHGVLQDWIAPLDVFQFWIKPDDMFSGNVNQKHPRSSWALSTG